MTVTRTICSAVPALLVAVTMYAPSSLRSVSLTKREASANWMKRSLSNGSLFWVQTTSGAGVPEASHTRVVG